MDLVALKKSVAWAVIVVFFGAAIALMTLLDGGTSSGAPQTVPTQSESHRVSDLLPEFSDGDGLPATIVFEDSSGLTPRELGMLNGRLQDILENTYGTQQAFIRQSSPVIPLDDTVARAEVSLPAELSGMDVTEVVEGLRDALGNELPESVTASVTGPAGFAADTANAFKGADFRLLGITAAVVAVLLIVTYRSPVLWLVPLIGIGLADRAAGVFTGWLSAETGWFASDGSTSGITSVLVFGAGTNYALLLVSRYREELRKETNHHRALARAVRASLPAIVASNLTVVLALLTLLAASVPAYRSLGLSSAIGLLFALAFALLLLPAMLSVTGRVLFWPKIPRPTQGVDRDQVGGMFYRIARAVGRKPAAVTVIMVFLLGVLGCGLATTDYGLSSTEQFRTRSEAVEGQKLVASHSAGSSSGPLHIIAPSQHTQALIKEVESLGLSPFGPPVTNSDNTLVLINVQPPGAPGSPQQLEAVTDIRSSLHQAVPDSLVGGLPASTVDSKNGTLRDMKVVIPLIFLVVFLVLIVVLRALVAPVLLLLAAALSAVAAMGVGAAVSSLVFQFPGLAYEAPLYSVLFLIALGIDYTVFLVLRAREEADDHGTRDGMIRAVGLTGGVITSAGIVLAAVFVVLGVLPLITLTQVGIIVSIGILVDTFLVRTIVVPALFELVGSAMWAPGRKPVADLNH